MAMPGDDDEPPMEWLTITLPDCLREYLDNDKNLSVENINVRERTVTLFDRFHDRVDLFRFADFNLGLVIEIE